MELKNHIKINTQSCIRCRRCERICSTGVFVWTEDRLMQADNNKRCIECGHCVDVCPTRSVIHPLFGEEKVHDYSLADLPTPRQVSLLLRARRSNRAFSSKEIPQESLHTIIEAAYTAPTAQNTRQVQVVAITDPEKIRAVTVFTVDTFARVAKLLSNPFVKFFLNLFMKKKMASVYAMIPRMQGMYRSVHEKQKDPVLRKAKAVLFFCAPTNARFGLADCNLAYQNASLMAESLGVAQFYTGFVLSAIKQDKRGNIYKILNLKDVQICAGMALAIPEFRFERYADRAHKETIFV